MIGGFAPPRIYAAVEAALVLESRDVTYFVIPVASVPTAEADRRPAHRADAAAQANS